MEELHPLENATEVEAKELEEEDPGEGTSATEVGPKELEEEDPGEGGSQRMGGYIRIPDYHPQCALRMTPYKKYTINVKNKNQDALCIKVRLD